MQRFLTRRLLALVVTLVFVSALVFVIPYASVDDPVRAILRARVSDPVIDPAAAAALRAELGLDRPLAAQYGAWLWQVLHGDFGLSFRSRLPVAAELVTALSVSASLALTALLLATLCALPLGAVAAAWPGGWLDRAITLLSQSLVAAPEYLLAPVAVLIFAVHLHWLPSAGWRGPESIVLPGVVLALRPFAYFTQIIRAAMIEVLRAPYITAARARGLSRRATILHHGLRNAMLPVISMFSLWLAGMLGGAVVVEVIFAVPGMGRLVYDAIINKDLPMLQAGILCTVGFAVLITTAGDLLTALVNPTVDAIRGDS